MKTKERRRGIMHLQNDPLLWLPKWTESQTLYGRGLSTNREENGLSKGTGKLNEKERTTARDHVSPE